MLTCPTCHLILPPAALACEACLAKVARAELLKHQLAYLPLVKSGTMRLRLTLENGQTHILLFGDWGQSYCGRSPMAYRRVRNPNGQLWEQDNLCQKCRSTLEGLLTEVRP